jgi:hypothetical protein
MTRSETLRKIREATEAIQEYRQGNIERAFGESIERLDSDIKTASMELIVEARTIGAAGRACPRCGGSGRA